MNPWLQEVQPWILSAELQGDYRYENRHNNNKEYCNSTHEYVRILVPKIQVSVRYSKLMVFTKILKATKSKFQVGIVTAKGAQSPFL